MKGIYAWSERFSVKFAIFVTLGRFLGYFDREKYRKWKISQKRKQSCMRGWFVIGMYHKKLKSFRVFEGVDASQNELCWRKVQGVGRVCIVV